MSAGRAVDPARWQAAADELGSLVGTSALPEGYLRFRARCAEAYARAHRALDEREPAPRAAPRPEGPVREDDLRAPLEVVQALFDELLAALSASGSGTPELARLAVAVSDRPATVLELAGLAVNGWDHGRLKRSAARLAVQQASLLLLGRLVGAPLVARAGRGADLAKDGSSAASGACPACLSPLGLARLGREDGGRTLVCSVCEHEWRFPRLRCPYCGTEDRSALGTRSVDEEPARWLEVCDRCRRYVKTVDERRLPGPGPVDPFVEETVTLPLDLLAEHLGYVRWVF